MNLIKFELKKLWRSRIFIIFLLISIGLVVGLFGRNYISQAIIKAEKISQFQHYAFAVQRTVITDSANLQELGAEGDLLLEKEIEVGRALADQLKQLVIAIDEDQAIQSLQLENEAYEKAIDYLELDKHFPLSVYEIEAEITLNNELLSLGLPKEDLTASIQPAVFSKQIVSLFFNSFGFFVLIIIAGLPVGKEFDDQTIKLTYSLPVAPIQMVMTKWLSMLISCFVWFGSVIGTALVVSLMFGKTVVGQFDYPFATEQNSFLHANDYLSQVIVYGLLYLILLVSLFTCLTFILQRTMLVQATLILFFIIVEMIISQRFFPQWFPWIYQKLDISVIQTVSASPIAIYSFLIMIVLLLLFTVRASARREIV